MIEQLFSVLTPHSCLSCGHQGSILCPVCKFYITKGRLGACLLCGKIADNICATCSQPWLAGARVIGWRDDELLQLGDMAKFERSREAARAMADMLDLIMPELPSDAVVTSVPTNPRHIRQRGYDFVEYLAKRVAAQRELRYVSLLERLLNTEQRGHGATEREAQAQVSYRVKNKPIQASVILLIDDVVTTGSTMCAIGGQLYNTFETPVFLVAGMRQPDRNL